MVLAVDKDQTYHSPPYFANKHMSGILMITEMEAMHAATTTGPHPQMLVLLLLLPNIQNSNRIGQHLRRLNWSFGSSFCLTGMHKYSRHRFSFSASRTLTSILILRSMGCLLQVTALLHVICKILHHWIKEGKSWSYDHGIYWSCTILTHPELQAWWGGETASLNNSWDSSLKTVILEAGTPSPECMCKLNQQPSYCGKPPIGKLPGPRNQWVKVKVASCLSFLTTRFGNFYIYSLWFWTLVLESLLTRMADFPVENTARIPIHLKLLMAHSESSALMLRDQQARRVSILVLIIRRRQGCWYKISMEPADKLDIAWYFHEK